MRIRSAQASSAPVDADKGKVTCERVSESSFSGILFYMQRCVGKRAAKAACALHVSSRGDDLLCSIAYVHPEK